jgi:tetratricopeptide (TPR) repeat protein
MTNFCLAGSKDYQSINSDLANSFRYHTPQDEGAFDEASLLAMRAKIHFQAGEYKEALDDLGAAMKAKLDDADKIFGSGDTKPEKSNNNPCVWTMGNLDALEAKVPRDYRVPLLRGIYIEFFTTFDEKYYQSAIEELQKAALLNPRSPYPPFFIGQVQMKSAFWTKAAWSSEEGKNQPRRRAITFYTKAVQLDPNFTLAYAMRASAYLGLKQYQQAIADYDKVLELDKENVIAYADRGLANLEIGRYLAATLDLGEAIRRKGEDGSTLSMNYEYRADAYAKMGAYRDAIENYSQAIKCQLGQMTHLISLKQIRGLYPEYDKVPDEALIRKINLLFWPQYDHTTMAKILTEKESEWKISMINDLYQKRGDCYLNNGDYRRGVLDFNRIFKGIPDFGQYVERWRSMGGKAGEEWFVDVKSTEFAETPRLWAKFTEKDKRYSVQAFEFDCKGRRIAVTSIAKYGKDEELVGSSDAGGGWQRIIPQTRGEQMYIGMCGK